MRFGLTSVGTAIVFVIICVQAVFAGTAGEWNSKGNQAFVAKRYEEAVVFYSNAIQSDNKCVQALYNRGLAYYRLDRLEDAWTDLTKLMEVDPKSHKASNLLGLVELKQGLYDSAFGRFRRASELQEACKYYFNAGLAAYKAGFYEVALKYGRDALAVNPKNERALKLVTMCKRAQERIEEAESERLAAEQARAAERSRLAKARSARGSRCSVGSSGGKRVTIKRRSRRKG